MEEATENAEAEGKIIVRSSRGPWARPWVLAPLGLILAVVMVMNTMGWSPLQLAREEFTPADVRRGREQLLQIEALRVLSVRATSGRLPESLEEIEVGLDRILRYEVLDDDRFLLDLVGEGATTGRKGVIYDAKTGRPEPAKKQP